MTTRLPTEERRRQIADAALVVIAAHGLGRFTTQAIAAEVGITDGTLFRHFASKQEIVLAALDRIEERLFEGFPPDDADPVARLERFFRRRAALAVESPVIARLAFSDELPHAAGAAGARQAEGWKRRTFGFVLACVEEAAARGRLPAELPPREVAVVVLGAVTGLVKLGDIAPASVDRTWSVLHSLFREVPS